MMNAKGYATPDVMRFFLTSTVDVEDKIDALVLHPVTKERLPVTEFVSRSKLLCASATCLLIAHQRAENYEACAAIKSFLSMVRNVYFYACRRFPDVTFADVMALETANKNILKNYFPDMVAPAKRKRKTSVSVKT